VVASLLFISFVAPLTLHCSKAPLVKKDYVDIDDVDMSDSSEEGRSLKDILG
jgi:hypothetical protein